MEGNLPAGNMVPRASYGAVDLQGDMRMHHQPQSHASFHLQQQPNNCQQPGSMFPLPMNGNIPSLGNHHMQDTFGPTGASFVDCCKVTQGKTCTSDDDDPNLTEYATDQQNESVKGKKDCPWQRMKWTSAMVKLLITAVSYVGEDVASECNSGGRRKFAILQKKGKWKAISKVMAERGCYVSPQQCEDKFNDLNKRYKRLTDILGRGTSCMVVENPALLDRMNISEKLKDDARKILSSKHLFYEMMCSYHNGNRVNLPADPALQHALQLELRNRENHDARRGSHEDDEDELSGGTDEEDAEELNMLHSDMGASCKKMKHRAANEEVGFKNTLDKPKCNRNLQRNVVPLDMNKVFTDSRPTVTCEDPVTSYSLHLEEKRLHIQSQMLELEQQRFKWQCFSRKKDQELNKMRMENERMKLENERLSLELKQKESEVGLYLNKNT